MTDPDDDLVVDPRIIGPGYNSPAWWTYEEVQRSYAGEPPPPWWRRLLGLPRR